MCFFFNNAKLPFVLSLIIFLLSVYVCDFVLMSRNLELCLMCLVLIYGLVLVGCVHHSLVSVAHSRS